MNIDKIIEREFPLLFEGQLEEKKFSREELRALLLEAVEPYRKDAAIVKAARNLVAQKGRHNTAIAYESLAAAIAGEREK